MVRVAFVCCVLALGACAGGQYDQPIKLTPHGHAVRANMAAQIIDPNPPRGVNNRSDGVAAQRGYVAYQEGETEDFREATTQESTAAEGG